MPLTRRALLQTSASALAAAQFVPGTAAAQASEEGVHRFAVGSIKGVMLHDGVSVRPLAEGFVRNAKLADVQAALAASGLPTDTIEITFTQTLIDTGSEVVLIDTGTGGKMGDTSGRMLAAMGRAGYTPDKVTRVVISHFHGDHYSGLTDKSGNYMFPNAEISVPAEEWKYWMDDGQMSRAPEGRKGNFEAVRKVFGPKAKEIAQLQPNKEIVPGLRIEPAPGHTPGHSIFRVSSGSDQALILSDTTNRPELFARNPDWHAVFDMDGAQAAETRKRIFEEVVTDRIRVSSYHYPFPAHGTLERDGNGFRFVPAA